MAEIAGHCDLIALAVSDDALELAIRALTVTGRAASNGIDDDKVLSFSDVLPTGWQATENAGIEPGDTVAVWGCGPVGLFAVQSAFLMGAERVVAIDQFPHHADAGACLD